MAVTGATAQVQQGASANSIGSAISKAGKITALAGAVGNAANLLSSVRSVSLPTAGESVGDIYAASAAFTDLEGANEWRVRLSIPTWPSFRTSVVMKPLIDAGGMIFPYTPDINITAQAKYTPLNIPHTNYNFHAYQNSDPGQIQITAPMYVEDQTQGLYWIAAMHYLRSLTKMFNGNDPKAGNPPPIVNFNAYGQYVFNNVPVAVTSFQTQLAKDCDYISVPVVNSAASIAQGAADAVGGITDALGSIFPGAGDVTAGIGGIAGGVGQVAALAGLFGTGGSIPGGYTHVPVKSTFTVTLQPMYARNTSQRFSLDRFVEGGYLNTTPGYI
jgi:hypothetical protein